MPADLTESPVVLAALALVAFLLLVRLLARRPDRAENRGTVEGVPTTVELRWTRHVRERMEQRQVTEDAVRSTLCQPHARRFDAEENSWRFERTFTDRAAGRAAGRATGETVKVWVSADPWPPRDAVVVKSTAAQRFAEVRIPRARIGQVIGRGGAGVTRIRRETGARIDVGDDGTVRITGDAWEQVARARTLVLAAARG